MSRRIVIIQGHPDLRTSHFCHALAAAYGEGAQEAGHSLKQINVATLEFPLLRTKDDFDTGEPPAAIRDAQGAIAWAEHLVIFYPLWLGTMPALLKGFFEQAFRPGFAAGQGEPGHTWKRLLKGRSARIVVTMAMPAFFYRWYFRAHGVKSFERNVLAFAGIGPIRETLIGRIDTLDEAKCAAWLGRMRALGRDAL
jgi:putative NADPH-quinone reductase